MRIKSIGGTFAFRTFERLCRSATLPQAEARWIHQLAYDVAERAARPPAWALGEFLKYAADQSLPLSDEQRAFVAIKRDVDEVIRNLQEGEFSIRKLLRSGNEKDMQLWLARELQLLSRGRYTLVREPEQADNTAPDLVAWTLGGAHKVTLELKLGDERSVNSLLSDLNRQLRDDYLRAQDSNFGLFVVMYTTDRARRRSVDHIRVSLEEAAWTTSTQTALGKHIEVRCFVCPPPISPRNQEAARKRRLRDASKST